MSFPASTSRNDAGSFLRPDRAESALRLDALQPLLAGAHARGMADALELAGVAAVLIDAHGMVLHVGGKAASLFGPELRVEYDHLVGADGACTKAIQTLIESALESALGQGELAGVQVAPVRLERVGAPSLVLRAKPVAGAAQSCAQLLKVLILIEESTLNPAHLAPL